MTKPTFSQREGLEPLKRELQLESMDDRLRNGLWNCLIKFREIMDEYDESKVDKFEVKVYEVELVSDKFKNLAWENFFGRRIDELTYDSTFPATFQKDLW